VGNVFSRESHLKVTTEEYMLSSEDFICDWCGRDTMNLAEPGDMDYITIHGPRTPETLPLCRSCFITAVQALQFGKEITQDCQPAGKRIYVAIERVEDKGELVNALIWPDHPLAERRSVTFRAT
jgi:hypothetical protein